MKSIVGDRDTKREKSKKRQRRDTKRENQRMSKGIDLEREERNRIRGEESNSAAFHLASRD